MEVKAMSIRIPVARLQVAKLYPHSASRAKQNYEEENWCHSKTGSEAGQEDTQLFLSGFLMIMNDGRKPVSRVSPFGVSRSKVTRTR